MILKKPYAFLIKNFKLLHIILFLILIFIVYKSNRVYNFYNDYLAERYYDFQEHFATTYVDIWLFISVILVILFAVTLYLLMRFKNKNKKFYFMLIISYLVLFFIFIFYFVYLTNMEVEAVDKKFLRIVRDSALVIQIPEAIFAMFALFRGLGFDLKTFNFAKDLEELNISSEDSEEFEIVFKGDGYKVKRNLRKTLKEIYYYVVENRQMLAIVVAVIIFAGLGLTFLDKKINTNAYVEGKKFYVNGFLYEVQDSYVSTVDYKGDEVKEGKKYVVVKFDVTNQNLENKDLDLNNIKLMVNNKAIYPILNKYDSFIDIGKGYKRGKRLKPNEKNEYIIVFEMDKLLELSDVKFRIIDLASLKEGSLMTKYSDAILKPKESTDDYKVKTYNLGQEMDLSDSNLLNTKVKIRSFNVKDSYEASYKYCANKDCFIGKDILTGNEVLSYPKCVVRMKIDITTDKNAMVFSNLTSTKEFLSNYLQVGFEIDGVEQEFPLTDITPRNTVDTYRYFETNEDLLDADKIKVFVLARDKKYETRIK